MDGFDYDNISRELFKLIMQIHRKTVRQDEFLKCTSMPPSHMKVIFYIQHFGPSTVSDVAKNLNISKPNMTPIIDNLVSSDLVKRYEDPNDRRKILLEVSEKGHKFLNKKKQEIVSSLSSRISTLKSEDDLKTLKESVEKLNEIIAKF